jgi:hypothetical protein
MNKSTINVSISKDKTFTIIPYGLRKTFNITVWKKSIFNLVIYGFNSIEKYLMRIRFGIGIVASLSEKLYGNATIQGGKYNLSFFASLFLQLVNTSVSNSINLIFSPKEKLYSSGSISQSINLSFMFSELYTYLSSIQSSIALLFVPQIREYYLLSDHDGKTLADMDVLTLAELDYQVI